jgi:branched-chain amino acid transport system substrate-binding protein
MGFKGALLGSDGWDSPQLIEQGGPALEAACYTGNFAKDEDRPEVRAFVQAYRAHYQADPDGFAALAYDAANILFDAIHRAGSSDGRAIQAALAGTDNPAVSGRIRFDASRNPPKPPLLLEVRNGQPLFRSRADQP